MPQIKVITDISKISGDNPKMKEILHSLSISSKGVENDFKTDTVNSFLINATSEEIIDLFTLSSIDPTKITLLHISLFDLDSDFLNANNKRFNLSFDSVEIDVSEITFVNCEGFNSSCIVQMPEIPANREMFLAIIIGLKK
jgi:hypothetical protein